MALRVRAGELGPLAGRNHRMRATTAIPLFVSFILTVVYVAAFPALAYSGLVAASIASNGDMGGPLNLVMVPAAGLVVGLFGGVLLVLLSPLFHKAPRIALLIPVVIGVFTFAIAFAWLSSHAKSTAWPIALSAVLSFWFGSAAMLFVVSDMIIRRMAESLATQCRVARQPSR
jgi:hypothetical protein